MLLLPYRAFAGAVALLILWPAAAGAQVRVQDQAATFLDERRAHQARVDANPQRWWSGNIGERSATPDSSRPYTMVPGNPLTVEPLFSFEEMMRATENDPGALPAAPAPTEAPATMAPTDVEQLGKRAIAGAAGLIAGALSGGGGAPDSAVTPSASQIPAAQPYNDLPPLAPGDIGTPTVIDPADAPALDELAPSNALIP